MANLVGSCHDGTNAGRRAGIRKRASGTSRVAAAVLAVSPRSRPQLTAAAWIRAREKEPTQTRAAASWRPYHCREQVTRMPALEVNEEARVLWQRAQHVVEQQQVSVRRRAVRRHPGADAARRPYAGCALLARRPPVPHDQATVGGGT